LRLIDKLLLHSPVNAVGLVGLEERRSLLLSQFELSQLASMFSDD